MDSQQGSKHKKCFYLCLAALIILCGFTLRANYLRQTNTYIDEYFTILAAEMIQQHGWPLLPSGLFYSHGFLYTYIVAGLGGLMKISGTLAGFSRVELIYQIPNLLISAAAMAMLFFVAKRWFGWRAALVAMALLAVYPHGIVWGARVRMYTLVYLLTPLLAYAFYRVTLRLHYRRWFVTSLILFLLATLVHNWILILAPALMVGVGLIGWRRKSPALRSWRGWLPGLMGISLIGLLSARLQSLWLEVPETVSQDTGWSGLVAATVGRLNFLTSINGNAFLWREFVWHNPFNLLIFILTLAGCVGLWFLWRSQRHTMPVGRFFWPMLYLYVLLAAVTLEFLLLLKPELKQPHYASPVPILAFIILGGWLEIGLTGLTKRLSGFLPKTNHYLTTILPLLIILLGFGALSARQIPQIFYEGLPAVGYGQALQFVRKNYAPGDVILSPLPAATYLYFGQPGYFIAQDATYSFVHINPQGILGDRWTGAPWLRTSEQLKDILRRSARVWLIIDTLSFESQFHSDWKQVMRSNTPKVWSEDGVMVFRGQGLTEDTPTEPAIPVNTQLEDKVKLVGYSRDLSPREMRLYLFWQAITRLPADYTTFVHIRNEAGQTIAQVDVQPFNGDYPTSRWRVGEMVVDRIVVPLPPKLPAGTYQLFVGLYQWDTLARLTVVNDTSGENAIQLGTFTVGNQ